MFSIRRALSIMRKMWGWCPRKETLGSEKTLLSRCMSSTSVNEV